MKVKTKVLLVTSALAIVIALSFTTMYIYGDSIYKTYGEEYFQRYEELTTRFFKHKLYDSQMEAKKFYMNYRENFKFAAIIFGGVGVSLFAFASWRKE